MSPVTPTYKPGSFGEWLRAHGYAHLGKVPLRFRSVARKLNADPGKVPANSPVVEAFATAINQPAAELLAFAKGPPLEGRWLAKITLQTERNSFARSKRPGPKSKPTKTPAPALEKPVARKTRRPPKHPKVGGNPVTRLLQERTGLTVRQVGARLKLAPATMSRLTAGELAPNNPIVPYVATAIGIPAKVFASYMKGPPMTAGYVRNVQKRLGKLTPPSLATGDAPTPGTAVVHVPKVAKAPNAEGRRMNKLRGRPVQVREVTRAFLTTYNVGVMKGDTHTPPIPLPDLGVLLVVLLEKLGLTRNVLLDPEYATLFDPK